jgi:hypothetical protein
MPVVHTCNLSYSGGRDQEDCSLRSAQANSSQDPISKDWWNGSRCRPWVQTLVPQKKKKKGGIFCLCLFLFCFSIRDGTQGLVHVRQVLYHWKCAAQIMLSCEIFIVFPFFCIFNFFFHILFFVCVLFLLFLFSFPFKMFPLILGIWKLLSHDSPCNKTRKVSDRYSLDTKK